MTTEPLFLDNGIVFTVPGQPAPQGSMRAFAHKSTGRVIMTADNKKTGPWRDRVALAAQTAMAGRPIYTAAVSVCIDFVLTRPKSAPKRTTPKASKRPDVDKLARACLDALTGVVLHDDSLVVNLHVCKRIAEIDEGPSATIRIELD